MTTSEKAIQKSTTRPRRSVHHTNFLWALCQELVLYTERERAVFYARWKLLEDVAYGLSAPGARRYAEVGLSHLDRTFGTFA